MTLLLEAPWLLAAGRKGLVAVGPQQVIQIDIDGPRPAIVALVDALATGAPAGGAGEVLGLDGPSLDDLRTALVEAGALVEGDGTETSVGGAWEGMLPLSQAIAATREGAVPTSCFTAEELLLLPPSFDPPRARRVLHAFIGGLRPEARGVAYGLAATFGDGVRGDLPIVDLAESAAGLDPETVHVVPLGGGTPVSLSPNELDDLGADRAHRLGLVQDLVASDRSLRPEDPFHVVRARYSAPNLRFVQHAWAHGVAGDPARAELIARAEAAERHSIGRTSGVVLCRAVEADLEGAVPPAALSAPNARQAASLPPWDQKSERLWVAARTIGGSRRWVPADAVLMPFSDPQRVEGWLSATSSGVAAHATADVAVDHALRELIERDALMWHWVQRVAPPRLRERPLSEETRARLAWLRGEGWEVNLLNLTLEALPVVLCGMRKEGRLSLGLSCARTAIDAAHRALEESLMIARMAESGLEPIEDPRMVRTPSDHLALHHHPLHAPTHEFLLAGDDEVDPRDVPAPEDPIPELLRPIGETLLVDHAVEQAKPFVVVRTLVPGLVPISFGYDREPLGLARLARPIMKLDGRKLGSELELEDAEAIMPHPFP